MPAGGAWVICRRIERQSVVRLHLSDDNRSLMSNQTDAPELQTQRLILRGPRLNDFEALYALWADMAVVRHISGEPSSREQSWSRLLRLVGHWQLLGFGYWMVTARNNGRFLGQVGFGRFKRAVIPTVDDWAEAGWVLKPAEHGKGYATEAVLRMVAWADVHFDGRATICLLHPDNVASFKVARKAGYAHYADGHYKGEQSVILMRPPGGRPANAP